MVNDLALHRVPTSFRSKTHKCLANFQDHFFFVSNLRTKFDRLLTYLPLIHQIMMHVHPSLHRPDVKELLFYNYSQQKYEAN